MQSEEKCNDCCVFVYSIVEKHNKWLNLTRVELWTPSFGCISSTAQHNFLGYYEGFEYQLLSFTVPPYDFIILFLLATFNFRSIIFVNDRVVT